MITWYYVNARVSREYSEEFRDLVPFLFAYGSYGALYVSE